MSASEIVFRDLPKKSAGGRHSPNAGKWVRILAPLVDRPGDWAVVTTRATPGAAANTAATIRQGRVELPPGRWEATTRLCDVYVRYMGPAK